MKQHIEHTPNSEEFDESQDDFLKRLGTTDPSKIDRFLKESEQKGDITQIE